VTRAVIVSWDVTGTSWEDPSWPEPSKGSHRGQPFGVGLCKGVSPVGDVTQPGPVEGAGRREQSWPSRGRESVTGPSRPEPRWDVTGSSVVGAAVTVPVTGGGWCKGWTCVRRDRAAEQSGI
jgi:hypothetical protein